MRTLVMIPSYNERENIEWIVGRVRAAAPAVDVLIVDDASPDGTGEIADALAAAHASVHVLHRAGKDGLGAAYREAMRWGIAAGYELLVEMDADGSHQPEQLPSLLEGAASADVVLGSRWVPGGSVVNWPRRRELISRAGSWYARTMLGLPYRDVTGGYRVFRAGVIERIDLDAVRSHGYSFQVDMLWHAALSGCRIVEVPITFVERERGASKMSAGIVLEAMWRVTTWAARRPRRRASVHSSVTSGAARGDVG